MILARVLRLIVLLAALALVPAASRAQHALQRPAATPTATPADTTPPARKPAPAAHAPAPATAHAPAPPSKPAAKQTTKPTSGSFNSMKVDASGIAPTEDTAVTTAAIRGRFSADSENVRNEPDRHAIVPKSLTFGTIAPHSLGRSERLMDDPAIGKYIELAVSGLKGFQINLALLAGHKYMINDCLGIKVNAGEFALTVPDPDLRVVGDEMVLTFAIPHVAMTALSVRLRPDLTDAMEPCHFSGAGALAGAADDLRFEMHFHPMLDLDQCKIGSMGQIHQVWHVGSVHLEPLPEAVTSKAGDMVGDALTTFANFNLVARTVAVLNAAAGTQCHK